MSEISEKELANKIRLLRQIKPSQSWVVFAKKRIFEQKEKLFIRKREKKPISFFSLVGLVRSFEGLRVAFSRKFAFASVLFLIVLFGLFGFARNSLPGDFLFPLKKAAESGQEVFIAQNDQIDYNLMIAQKRLEDLVKVVQKNSVKNLAPAINEYQANISKVADNLVKEKDKKRIKETVLKMAELQNKESEIKSYGVEIGSNQELEKAYAQKIIEMLESLIQNLKNRNLTEEQKNILKAAEKDLENKNYEGALIKILSI
jgi:hypothetical protein